MERTERRLRQAPREASAKLLFRWRNSHIGLWHSICYIRSVSSPSLYPTGTVRPLMFAFLKSSAQSVSDPLASVRAASAWLDELPTLDIVARQQLVLRAFDATRQSARALDTGRGDALQHLDAALRGDRRKLFRQFVENAEA